MFKKHLAINIEQNSIKFIEYRIRKNSKKVFNIINESIPNKVEDREAFIKNQIKDTLTKNKWNSHIINLNAYSSDLYIRGIQIPVIPADEILIVLKREIKRFYGDIRDQKLIYEIMGELDRDGKKEYLIFYVILPEHYYHMIENLDIKINSLDFDVFALDRIFKLRLKEKGNTMFIDFGFENLKLFIYIDENLAIYREVNIGGDEITKTISNFLQINYEEAEELKKIHGYVSKQKTEELLEAGEKRGMYLNIAYQSVMDKIVRKLVHSIDYFKNQNKGRGIDKIFLCGGSSKLKNVKDLLAEELQVDDIEIYTGMDNFDLNKNLEEKLIDDVPCYTNMLGMALLDRILHKPTKNIKKNITPKQGKSFLKVAIIAIVLLMPLIYVVNKEYRNYIKSAKELTALQNNLLIINDAIENYDETEKKYNKIINDEDRFNALDSKKNKIIDFFYDVSHIIYDGMYFENLTFDKNTISIKGIVLSDDDFPMIKISNFTKKIEEKYDNVTIKDSKKEEFNYKASFNMELKIGGELDSGSE